MTKKTMLMMAMVVIACCLVTSLPQAKAASEWHEVAKYLAERDPPAEYAPKTSQVFPRDLSELVPLVRFNRDVPNTLAGIKDWVLACRALRQGYKPTREDTTKTRAVVVGGGPIGLHTALMLTQKKTHRVVVLEKTNGEDKRWNSLMNKGALLSQYTDLLRLQLRGADGAVAETGDWVPTVGELELVVGASLVLAGVDVRYNTQFMHFCDLPEDKHSVQWRATPHDNAAERNRRIAQSEVCTGTQALGPARGQITDVGVLVGAGGVGGPVRELLTVRNVLRKVDYKTNQHPLKSVPGSRFLASDQTAFEADVPAITLQEQDDNRPLLVHVIVSFKGSKDLDLTKLDNAMFAPTVRVSSDAPSKKSDLREALKSKRDKKDDKKALKPLARLGVSTKPEDLDFSQLVGSAIPHKMSFTRMRGDGKGAAGERVYLEMLMRHKASKAFHEKYASITGRDDMGPLEAAAAGDKHAFGDPAKDKLAESLLQNLYRMLDAGVGTATWTGLFPKEKDFRRHIEHVKIFGQQLRAARRVTDLTRPGLKIVIAGDAARDSYYVRGNSVVSAFNLLHKHWDNLMAPGTAAAAAEEYKREVVDEFTAFVGADIFLRTYCGCEMTARTESSTHWLERPAFSDTSCRVPAVTQAADGCDGWSVYMRQSQLGYATCPQATWTTLLGALRGTGAPHGGVVSNQAYCDNP